MTQSVTQSAPLSFYSWVCFTQKRIQNRKCHSQWHMKSGHILRYHFAFVSLSLWSASLNGVVRAINCRCKTIKCRIRKFSLGLSKVVSFFVWLIIYCIRIHTTFLSHSSSFSFSENIIFYSLSLQFNARAFSPIRFPLSFISFIVVLFYFSFNL